MDGWMNRRDTFGLSAAIHSAIFDSVMDRFLHNQAGAARMKVLLALCTFLSFVRPFSRWKWDPRTCRTLLLGHERREWRLLYTAGGWARSMFLARSSCAFFTSWHRSTLVCNS